MSRTRREKNGQTAAEDPEGDLVELAEGIVVRHFEPSREEAEGNDQKARQHRVDRDEHMVEHGCSPFLRGRASADFRSFPYYTICRRPCKVLSFAAADLIGAKSES